MKKLFDLEAFKAGHKALTRDGRIANFIGVCEKCCPWQRLLVLMEGGELIQYYYENGTYVHRCYNQLDLILVGNDVQELIDAHKLYVANPPPEQAEAERSSRDSYRTPLQEFRSAMFV